MGKLRTEPISKNFLPDPEYKRICQVLHSAKKASKEHNVYWDLEEGERVSVVKKSFIYVAEQENLNVTIRRVRGENSLAIQFLETKTGVNTRIPADESRRRILDVLSRSKKAMKKSQIIKETGIAASTWNLRIKELVQAGLVERQGERRDTTYRLTKSPL